MRTSRFYYQGPLLVGAQINLPDDTSHYILRVLRLKQGTEVILFNGDSNDYLAEIINSTKKTVTLTVKQLTETSRESPIQIHLVQGVSRGEKMDWTIQKAVELGVSRITPLITEYCTIKVDDAKKEKRLLHWQKIAISACEQSGRSIIPLIDPIEVFKDWILNVNASVKLFCDPQNTLRLSELPPSKDVLFIIGPEGGLSMNEKNSLLAKEFCGISLGPRIMRTETAALSAIAIIQSQWGDV